MTNKCKGVPPDGPSDSCSQSVMSVPPSLRKKRLRFVVAECLDDAYKHRNATWSIVDITFETCVSSMEISTQAHEANTEA